MDIDEAAGLQKELNSKLRNLTQVYCRVQREEGLSFPASSLADHESPTYTSSLTCPVGPTQAFVETGYACLRIQSLLQTQLKYIEPQSPILP